MPRPKLNIRTTATTATTSTTPTATGSTTSPTITTAGPNEEAAAFTISSPYDAYDGTQIRQLPMSTFRNGSSYVSIGMEPLTSDGFRGHSNIAATTATTVETPQTPMESPPPISSTSAPLPGMASVLVERRRPKAGILRLDINKPRRSSGGSVEFCAHPQWLGENSSSSARVVSPHQLSVTWAESCDINESHLKLRPMQECTEDANINATLNDKTIAFEERQTYDLSSPVELGSDGLPLPHYLSNEFNGNVNNNWNNSNDNQDQDTKDEDDDEDYSVSVSAIMQRRASIRGYRHKRGSRSSRRASSPMEHVLDSMEARRRSSVYTSSSDEGANQESTQEQIFENIGLHKEVIQSVKLQPWPIRKKLKLVRQAKTYVARHEGALQERFAMSRSTKDLFARFKILMAARWRHWKRETNSFLTVLIPWELRIKEIESHFGSGVASYFTFLRWLMWVNIMIAIPLVAFVIGPEYFATKHDETDPRKKMSEEEYKDAGNLNTIWEFEGYIKYSPMFYGYYSSESGVSSTGYKLPLAYFLTAVVVYIYSFVAILRKMAENSRNSKLSSKDDECTFSWKLFTGWDFMIGHAETAHNRIASVVVGFKEALLEEAEKKKDKRNWRIILQRILVNILVMGLLAASGYTVVFLVNKSEDLNRMNTLLSRNAVNITMTLLSFFLPMIFEALGLFENWHPRQQLRLQLARKGKELQNLQHLNETKTREMKELKLIIQKLSTTFVNATTTPMSFFDDSTTPMSTMTTTFDNDMWNSRSSTNNILFTTGATTLLGGTFKRLRCYNVTTRCKKLNLVTKLPTMATTLLFMNLTATMWPQTTEPIASIMSTASSNYLMTTSALSTVDTTMNFDTSTDELPSATSSSLANTEMIGKLLTTPVPNDYDKISTSMTLYPSQTPTTTTTTTTSTSAGDTFFDFYDYFAGFPIELDKEKTKNGKNANNGSTANRLKRPTNEKRKKVKTLKSAKGKKLGKKKANEFDERTNRITKRHSQLASSVFPFIFTNPPKRRPFARYAIDDTETTTTQETEISTIQNDYRAFSFNVNGDNNARYTDTTNPTNPTKPTDPTDPTNPNYIKSSQSELWVQNTDLPEISAYFTNSTNTVLPPPITERSTNNAAAPTTTSAPTTEVTTERTTASSFKSSTQTFLDEKNVKDVGEPKYYNMSEIDDDDDFEDCVHTKCDEVLDNELSATHTTKADDETETEMLSTVMSTNDTTKLFRPQTPLEEKTQSLSEVEKLIREIEKNLTSMCWETSLGQELSKVILIDWLLAVIAAPLCIDFLRALFVRYANQHWCWDMEKTFPQYGDFKIAENILTLIYNQGQVWMGIFFSPGLVLINLAKLVIMMYFRSWIVLTCNVPHEVVFKASKSNNFYLTLLLTMLFLCVLPVGYAIVWLPPSWHCGPFSKYKCIAEFITNTTRNALPEKLHEPLDYLTSASTVIPLLLLLVLIIYYLISLTGALREANQDLRTQLQKEREEERRKMFKVPEIKPIEPPTATLTSRWRKVLEASSPVMTTQPPDFQTEEYKNQARKELISRIMKKALRKSSATSDEDSVVRQGRDDDDTDTEHHDSLPHDEEGKERIFSLSKLQSIRRSRKPSLVDIVQIARNERERERKASEAAAVAAAANANATATATTASGITPTGATAPKEAYSKENFKGDRHERRKKMNRGKNEDDANEQKEKAALENEHDPEVNSRIVNERRESLLRRKTKDDESKQKEQTQKSIQEITSTQTSKKSDEQAVAKNPSLVELEKLSLTNIQPQLQSQPPSQSQSQPQAVPAIPKRRTLKSSFKVIHEKINPQGAGGSTTPRIPALEGGKFKFIRQRIRSPVGAQGNEPEVFKFDEKMRTQKLGKPIDIPTLPSTDHFQAKAQGLKSSGEDVTPPHTPSVLKYTNSEKLASLSRQGRKKIGSFLNLMREAARKLEIEQLQQQLQENGAMAISEPTTPIPIPTSTPTPTPTPTPVSSSITPTTIVSTSPQTSDGLQRSSSATELPKEVAAVQIDIPMASTATKNSPESSKTSLAPSAKAKQTPAKDSDAQGKSDIKTSPQKSLSLGLEAPKECSTTTQHDSQTSTWTSDQIPTITISTTGSDECVAESDNVTSAADHNTGATPSATATSADSRPDSSTAPKENIIKITIENEK